MEHVSFFSWGSSSFPKEEAHCKTYTTYLHKVLVVQITTFLLSVEKLTALALDEGIRTLGWGMVRWGVLELCAQ
jgi:hypothetical protein